MKTSHLMARIIKRYENRKLYDTDEKRYISLDDIAELVRAGAEVTVVDNATGADLTAQTLAKVILEQGAGSRPGLPPQFLHDVLRYGNRFVAGGMEQVHSGFDRLVEASLQRLGPVREVRQEMARVRERLERLEGLISEMEEQHGNDTDRPDGSAGRPDRGNEPEHG
jgi:polyhydroxyalkanoate synthesis repressor PhaR